MTVDDFEVAARSVLGTGDSSAVALAADPVRSYADPIVLRGDDQAVDGIGRRD